MAAPRDLLYSVHRGLVFERLPRVQIRTVDTVHQRLGEHVTFQRTVEVMVEVMVEVVGDYTW